MVPGGASAPPGGERAHHVGLTHVGRQRGQTEFYRGNEYTTAEVPKVRIDVAVASGQAEAVIEAIQKAAGSGKIGDGKIFVSGLTEVVRIRTGERDEKALD